LEIAANAEHCGSLGIDAGQARPVKPIWNVMLKLKQNTHNGKCRPQAAAGVRSDVEMLLFKPRFC